MLFRSDSNIVSFDELMETDLILCIRGLIGDGKQEIKWYPRTLVFAERHAYHGFDLFFRAESKRYFDVVKILLNIKNKVDLIERFNQAYTQHNLDRWRMGLGPIPFASYMNLENLYEV